MSALWPFDLEVDVLKSRIAELKAEIEPLFEMVQERRGELYELERELERRRRKARREAKKALEKADGQIARCPTCGGFAETGRIQ